MTERLQRPYVQPPNTINRRVSLINGVTRHEAAWEGPGGLLASLTVTEGRAQLALVDGGVVIDAGGATIREAYRAAWHEMRVERARRNVEQLLEQRARSRRTVTSLIRSVNEAYALSASQMTELDRRGRTIKRLEEENTALKAQTVQQAQDMQALRDQLAAAQRAPEDVSEKVQTLEKRVRALQGKLTAALAHQATTQGHYDELRKQHGLPTSADLAVNAARPASFAGESAAPVVGEAHS